MRSINGMFFEFAFVSAIGDSFLLSAKSSVVSEDCYAARYAAKVISGLGAEGKAMEVELKVGVPEEIKERIGKEYCENEEGYALVIGEKIWIYGQSQTALKYGVATLQQLIEANAVREMVLFDYPDKKIRGYRVYMPGEASFQEFQRVLDMMVYYKYNSIIIEVGGAMEYKKHPEINAKWVEFCEEVHRGPHEYDRIQHKTHPQWAKNSIHADNGDGGFITQEQVKEVLSWCRERELDVIPEVPCLSHSDYIVMAHPDLNERKEDTYPDTYCPSNPKSYEILFDIMDEVIQVFEPRIVNIGHDEIYTLAKCERCKDKDPVELYVGDIVKVSNYLKERGIETLMWCEKMFGNWKKYGSPCGGAANPKLDIPALYQCKGKIPKDVRLLHWYWNICDFEEEQSVLDLGYNMIFGNFEGLICQEYRRRSSQMDGGFVSNWGSMKEEYMQRNGQNFSLIGTAYIFWNREYDTDSNGYVYEKLKKELYRRYLKSLGKDIIEVLHTTDQAISHYSFYDGYFIVEEEWLLGYYDVTYTDGTMAQMPVLYGYNIDTWTKEDTIEHFGRKEALGASIPVSLNGRTYYKTAYANPYPEKEIRSMIFRKAGAYDPDSYKVIWYAEQGEDRTEVKQKAEGPVLDAIFNQEG